MDDQNERAELRRAQVARDRARLRLRRATGGAIAGAIALSGTFAALAAGTTQAKKVVVRLRPAARQGTALPPLTVAPRAPLVAAHTAPPPPPPVATQSQSAPAQSYAPPVVVSGGS